MRQIERARWANLIRAGRLSGRHAGHLATMPNSRRSSFCGVVAAVLDDERAGAAIGAEPMNRAADERPPGARLARDADTQASAGRCGR